MTFKDFTDEVLKIIKENGLNPNDYDLVEEALDDYEDGVTPTDFVWKDKRDYFIITDGSGNIIGTAEVPQGSLTDRDLVTPHGTYASVKIAKVSRKDLALNRERHGKSVQHRKKSITFKTVR